MCLYNMRVFVGEEDEMKLIGFVGWVCVFEERKMIAQSSFTESRPDSYWLTDYTCDITCTVDVRRDSRVDGSQTVLF